MKTRTIPFDLETAKKIQAGELEGKIKTRDGKDVRVICWDKKNNILPIVALVSSDEYVHEYRSDGYFHSHAISPQDLVLEVLDNKPQFKPFDRVLVRDKDNQVWWAGIFSHIDEDGDYCICGMSGRQCIPYEGNQDLVGTTKMPKEN